MKVHILATCRKPELLPGTLLVFDTIRKGFPNYELAVYDNANGVDEYRMIAGACSWNDCNLVTHPFKVNHGDWVDALAQNESEPFWICDTDMLFWKSVEDWEFDHDVCLAGVRMPEFFDLYSKSWSQPRMHTCLLYVNPKAIEVALRPHHFPPDDPFQISRAPMVKPFWFVDHTGRRVFYDTAAMLSNHVKCQAFTDDQRDCFDHLNAGTYFDLIRDHYDPKGDWHERVFANPEMARGVWRTQDRMFAGLGVKGPSK